MTITTPQDRNIRKLRNRLLATPEHFDQLYKTLNEKQTEALKASHHWVSTFITQIVNKGPGKVEGICPFVKESLNRGEMLFSIAQPQNPESLDDIHTELMTYAQIFCDIEPKDYPKCLHKCVIPIFPDTPGKLITEAIVHHSAREDLLKMGIMVGDASPDRDFQATWDPTFNPMQSPYPLYALRSFIPTDWRFINNSDNLRAIYKARFGEPKDGDEYNSFFGKIKWLANKVKRKLKH